MALIIPPGYLHAVYEMSLTGDAEPMVTTCGHEYDSATFSLEQCANYLMTAFGTTIFTQVVNAYALTGVTVYGGSDSTDKPIAVSTLASITGGAAVNGLPPNTAYLLRKRTDLAGRRGRGRMYIPGVAELQVDSVGLISGAHLTNLNTMATDWLGELNDTTVSGGLSPVVLHRSEGIGIEPAPTPIQSFVFDLKVATQRRRLRP